MKSSAFFAQELTALISKTRQLI